MNRRAGGPSWLAPVGMVLSVVVAALLVDPRLRTWAPHWKHPALDALVGLINPIGAGATLLVACVALTVICRGLGYARLRDTAWLAALTFSCAGITEFAIKHLVGRARPDAGLASMAVLGPGFRPDVDSFPSGHATSVFAVATIFASAYPRVAAPAYALAAAIALGRVYLERHYLSDIVAGAMIGILFAAYLWRWRHALPRWMVLVPAPTTAGLTTAEPTTPAA
ncbi:MAG TPA: phosphatase PAP2 family protein [Methylomirabilota bacterium]|nr:phosphatase PAP2 family protein [Methylomirabilota bacterium]